MLGIINYFEPIGNKESKEISPRSDGTNKFFVYFFLFKGDFNHLLAKATL